MNNYITLVDDEKQPIAAYDNEYKGKRYFHIRRMYFIDGQIMPGKGLAVEMRHRHDLLIAISKLLVGDQIRRVK